MMTDKGKKETDANQIASVSFFILQLICMSFVVIILIVNFFGSVSFDKHIYSAN